MKSKQLLGRTISRPGHILVFGMAFGLAFAAMTFVLQAAMPNDDANMNQLIHKMQELDTTRGYLDAHKDVSKPFDLLGGAVKVTIEQKSGGVFVALPDNQELDPRVFGTPEYPQAYTGTPAITGVPIPARNVENGKFTTMKEKTPFGNKYLVMKNGNLTINATDETATDAAVTKDKVDLSASWQDKDGNTYKVTCNKPISYGLEYPTFGGVVTNIILHGFSHIGTPLMPSEYTYFAFWGIGTLEKNGKVVDEKRVIYGMLTEYVRTEGYKLGLDKDVTPTRRQFHLMVAPFKPDKQNMIFEKSPVLTGFNLPNGMELPSWHVMFENLDIRATRG